MPPFADSREHLLAELERIDLLIRARVAHLRRVHAEDEHFRGLYISEQEVDRLLDQPLGVPQWMQGDDRQWLAEADGALAALAGAIEQRRSAAVAAGRALRLDQLQQRFALERFDLDVMLVALAVELDGRYERLYAYLQDDVTRKRPTVELAIQLLARSPAERLARRERFHAGSALLAHQIVHLLDDPAQTRPPLIAKYLKPDERIVQFLLGSDEVDERLRSAVGAADPAQGLDALLVDPEFKQTLRQVWPVPAAGAPPVLVLRGPMGAGKRSIARALCHELGLPMLGVEVAALGAKAEAPPAPGAAAPGLRPLLALVEREARLRGAVLHWRGLDEAATDDERSRRAAVLRAIDESDIPCIVSSAEALDTTVSFLRRGGIALVLPEPVHKVRHAAWTASLAGSPLDPGADLAAVATRFRLSPGQISRAAASAMQLARLRGGAQASIAQRDLLEACRQHSNQRLGSLARKIAPHHCWEDIVLPPDRLAQLREICNQIKYRDRVYGDWGFGRKLALGKGLAVLFAGPSGTGKTMAAGIIAGELGLDLYKIDLSSVVSKYIGETEKNLSRIFDEAETSNAILFFDEADALFGKRSEVRDSHDRYANIEVGFLLQRMEEYEGVAILATNFRKNMDDAFVRRLHFTVEFPLPDAQHRHLIWQGIWPRDLPREPSLDLPLLAERYEMTGGNIKNVALAAAFLAADDDQIVRLGHVVRAIQREYQKTGKLMDRYTEFARADDRERR